MWVTEEVRYTRVPSDTCIRVLDFFQLFAKLLQQWTANEYVFDFAYFLNQETKSLVSVNLLLIMGWLYSRKLVEAVDSDS